MGILTLKLKLKERVQLQLQLLWFYGHIGLWICDCMDLWVYRFTALNTIRKKTVAMDKWLIQQWLVPLTLTRATFR